MLRLKEEAKKAGLEIKLKASITTQMYKKLDQKNHEMGFAGFRCAAALPALLGRLP
jgi:microcin C transport system substrate-binding protein